MKILNFNPKKSKAQAMVEFAIVLPILLLVVYGLIETGRLIFIYSSVNNATRQAARFGSTSGVGPNNVPRYQDCAGIRDAAQRGDFLDSFDDVDITISYDHGPGTSAYDTCSGTTDTGVSAVTGDRVLVNINADFNAIVPNLVPFISRTITAESSRTLLLTISIKPPKEDTITIITADTPDPSEVGQPVTVTVTVTANTTPTGTVNISGADTNCSITLSGGTGGCVVNFNTANPELRTITASYTGDDKHNPSSDTESHTVKPASTVTEITADTPDPSVVGGTVTVAINVTNLNAWGGIPSGTVAITGADTAGCTVNLSSGTGNCNLNFTSIGTKLLTATYSGDATHQTSNDTELHNVLPPGQSTTTITSDNPDPSAPGQVTVNVSVTGSITPTGTVTVSGGGSTCSFVLANGTGSCPITFSTTGSYTITADYPGDNNNQGSSDTESHTVELPATTTQITFPGGNSGLAGQPVTVVVTVTGGSTPPTGTVTVTTPIGVFCTLTLPATSCTGTFNIAGNVPLTASYSPTSAHAPSSGTANYSVSVAGCTQASFTLGILQQPGGQMTLGINNTLPVAIQFSNISVTWNHDKGHKGDQIQTLILQSASLGSVFWTGTEIGATYTITPASPIFIPSGLSTLAFTFHQIYDRWDDTEAVTINLITPGCEGVILFQNQHN